MNSNISDRLLKIKLDRSYLLNTVKDTIKSNGELVYNNISQVEKVIEFDEENVNKYTAVLQAQDIINNLVNEIANCDSIEDIVSLRRKLNYYINKVKKELKKRNLDETYVKNYEDSIVFLRKNVAKYLRFLKRNNNVLEIENMGRNYDNLSSEDVKALNHKLSLEEQYNKRNYAKGKVKGELDYLLSDDNKKTKKSTKTSVSVKQVDGAESKPVDKSDNNSVSEVKTENISLDDEKVIQQLISQLENSLENFNFDIDLDISDSEDVSLFECVDNVSNISIQDYLTQSVASQNVRFQIADVDEYKESHFSSNISTLIRNIPIYVKNQKNIKRMRRYAHVFYRGADIMSYIEYLKRKNSIITGLRSVFSKTYLYSKEGQYLNNHEYCVNWLLEYCDEHNMDIKFLTKSRNI